MIQTFLFYFAYFFIYSVAGWLIETTFIMIKNKKFINRGFLVGPYCPIYGYGSIIMILYLTQYKDNILTVFILGVVICGILEYFTSYIMEILFKTRWWDYSDHKINLNGRICGSNCLLFGIGGIIVIYFIQPILENLLTLIPNKIFYIITIITLIIFITDTVFSMNIINRFKKNLTSLDLKKDSTQEITKAVREVINNNHKIFQKRLMSAFPNSNFNNLNNLKKDLKELIKKQDK